MTALLTLTLAFIAAQPCLAAEVEQEPLVITATRISEDVALVPASVSVVGGEELRNRGASDLRGALSLLAGVDIAPGSDGGPAAANPEFWGLKEHDAFLLVVDGVPYGGAFNPALATLDLRDVERVEVLRGAAPVMYGATSFVGVVHVIHKDPAKVQRQLRAYAGSYGSLGGGVSAPLTDLGKLKSSFSAGIEKQGFRDPRAKVELDRAHWRGQAETAAGSLRLNAGATLMRGSPASPHLRQGTVLSSKTPLDSNHNPRDAFLNEDRYSASVGLDHPLPQGTWSTLVSYSHSAQAALRGFLNDITVNPNSSGFRETTYLTDIYFDTHAQWLPKDGWKLVGGFDHLHGRGFGHGGDFTYQTDLTGAGSPTGDLSPSQSDIKITDQRDFSGLYGFAEWEPHPRWLLEAGVRLNRTQETRATANRKLSTQALTVAGGERHDWRASESVGATWRAWSREKDLFNLFAAYRNTFKPAAVDFGLATNAGILSPETAESYEAGFKSRWCDDRFDADFSWFLMDFTNQVINTTVNGAPALANAGATRFQGIELETAWHPLEALTWQLAYSYHDARFRDSVQMFGATPTQLYGKRLETTALNMFATGLTYAPKQGLMAGVQVNYVGDRYLDKRNRALVKDYVAWNAGVGYRRGAWEMRLDGRNLADQRPPVSESELGDAQYYLLPARSLLLSAAWNF